VSSAFEQATAIEPTEGEGAFRVVVPDHWQQGKGAFGGVVVGILTRAIVATEGTALGSGRGGDGRSLRSLSADLAAPLLPGPAEVRVSPLRRGGSMSFIDARLSQGGAVVARASAVLATPRAVAPASLRLTPPARPPWSEVDVLPVAPPLGPVFAQWYEYRSTGPLPFTAGKEPIAEGWIREKALPTVIDEAAIVSLLDSYWPATFAIESMPRAMATVGYTMQLLCDPRKLRPAEPLFYRARAVAGADNFFVEMRELWSGDAIVGMNQQTFAILT
jgi:hypothetical protein